MKKYKENINNKINRFSNWTQNHIPKNVKKTANKKIEELKRLVNRTVYDTDKPELKEQALKGFSRTYRIKGKSGYDPIKYLESIKLKVINFWEQRRKDGPFKVRTI